MADKTFKLEIISTEKKFYEGDISFAEFHTTEGDVGIYPKHIPMTLFLVPGVASFVTSEGKKVAVIHSGFIVILEDKISVLAESVEWPDEIDVNRAKEAKERAEARIAEKSANTDMAKAEMALKRSIARINAAENYRK